MSCYRLVCNEQLPYESSQELYVTFLCICYAYTLPNCILIPLCYEATKLYKANHNRKFLLESLFLPNAEYKIQKGIAVANPAL